MDIRNLVTMRGKSLELLVAQMRTATGCDFLPLSVGPAWWLKEVPDLSTYDSIFAVLRKEAG